jgi:hypothetical protein
MTSKILKQIAKQEPSKIRLTRCLKPIINTVLTNLYVTRHTSPSAIRLKRDVRTMSITHAHPFTNQNHSLLSKPIKIKPHILPNIASITVPDPLL